MLLTAFLATISELRSLLIVSFYYSLPGFSSSVIVGATIAEV